MKYFFVVLMIVCTYNVALASSKLDKPIFDDGRTLLYFSRFTDYIRLEIAIGAANGSGTKIVYSENVSPTSIPNTLSELYHLFPSLQNDVKELLPDDHYLMIEESLSVPQNEKGRVKSFIGAYAHEIKELSVFSAKPERLTFKPITKDESCNSFAKIPNSSDVSKRFVVETPGITSITTTSTDDIESSVLHTKILRRTFHTPIEIADFLVVIDNKQFSGDPCRRPLDPLKLQKLLYYSFAYNLLVTGEHLWDLGQYPIIANYHGPFVGDVHNQYNGYTIEPSFVEIAQKRLDSSIQGFNDLKNILYSTYLCFIDKTGKDLEKKSHGELPYQNAVRLGICSPISVQDINTEFSSAHKKTDLIKGLLSLIKLSQNINEVEKIIRTLLISLPPVEISGILDNFEVPMTLQLCIADDLYPQELLSNVDAKDSLFGRPRIIEKVAISARLGNSWALKDLAEIFDFFSCDSTDLYGQTSALILSKLKDSSYDYCFNEIAGYAEYERAQQQTTPQDAISLYQASLDAGYARSGFEIAKICIDQEKFSEAKIYLNKAFERGMLTATDLLMELPDDVLDETQKRDYLRKRGDQGDPIGYYQLAKKMHLRGNLSEAVHFYKMSLPFHGITEIRKILKKNPHIIIGESSLSKKDFFRDIIELYHHKTLIQIWDRDIK